MGWEKLAKSRGEHQAYLLSIERSKKPTAAFPPGDQVEPRQRDG